MKAGTIRVVLPAHNEAPNIGGLLEDILRTRAEVMPHRAFAVLVVDDGSVDDTAAVVERFIARQEPDPDCVVELVRHPENRGLAEAIRTGLTTAAERSGEHDVILTMDADNSHVAGLIPSMVRVVSEGYDLAIASRYRPGAQILGVPLHRRFLSFGASLLFQALFPIPGVRDYTCGFRAYRAGLVREVFAENPHFITQDGFSCMVDILLKLRTRRPPVTMAEVPLLLRYDKKEGASKMNVPKTLGDTMVLVVRRRLGMKD